MLYIKLNDGSVHLLVTARKAPAMTSKVELVCGAQPKYWVIPTGSPDEAAALLQYISEAAATPDVHMIDAGTLEARAMRGDFRPRTV